MGSNRDRKCGTAVHGHDPVVAKNAQFVSMTLDACFLAQLGPSVAKLGVAVTG